MPWTLSRRRTGSKPPCTMGKRFCLEGFEWAAMQRSSQRIERRIASATRSPVVRECTTSSSCLRGKSEEEEEEGGVHYYVGAERGLDLD